MKQEISLDHWTTLFLLASVQGLFLAFILLMHKKGNIRATKLLGLDILFFSFTLLYYVAYWTGFATRYVWVNGWTGPLVFLYGPLTYFYLKELEQPSLTKKRLLHLVPFALNCIWMIPFVIRNVFGRVEWLRIHFFRYGEIVDPVSRMWIILSNVSLVGYAIAMHLFLKQDKEQLNKFASKEEISKHTWLKKVVWFYSGFVIASASYWILAWTGVLELQYDYLISVTMSAFIYMVGYLGFRQPEIFHGYYTSSEHF